MTSRRNPTAIENTSKHVTAAECLGDLSGLRLCTIFELIIVLKSRLLNDFFASTYFLPFLFPLGFPLEKLHELR